MILDFLVVIDIDVMVVESDEVCDVNGENVEYGGSDKMLIIGFIIVGEYYMRL